jgi:hypothetical protein
MIDPEAPKLKMDVAATWGVCWQCGSRIVHGAQFCSHCGVRVRRQPHAVSVIDLVSLAILTSLGFIAGTVAAAVRPALVEKAPLELPSGPWLGGVVGAGVISVGGLIYLACLEIRHRRHE